MSPNQSIRESLVWALVIGLVLFYALLPIAWMTSLSLKTGEQLSDGRFFPREVSFENYRTLANDPQFPAALGNSIGIGLVATSFAMALGVLAAYALVRFRFRGKRALLAGSLAVAMFPQVSLVGPLFDLWRRLGLFDTWAGLVIPYVSLTLPLAIWTSTAVLGSVPWELEHAARVDGASRLVAFRRIILPLVVPGLTAAAILVFVFAWNEFLFALALTSTNDARTVPAAIAFFTGSSRFEQPTGSIAAAAVVVTVPVTLVVLLFQRHIVSGLTRGAVRG